MVLLKSKIMRIWIVVLAVTVTVILAFVIPYYSNPKEQDGYLEGQEKKAVEEPEISDKANEQVIEAIKSTDDKLTQEIEKKDIDNEQEINDKTDIEDNAASINVPQENKAEEDKPKEAEEIHNENKPDIEAIVVKEEVQVKEPAKYSDQWVEVKIEEHKDEIQGSDLTDFRNIIGKLDIPYANSLLNNSDSEEGLANFKQYMHSKLSDNEYSRAKQLFARYNFILSEEE